MGQFGTTRVFGSSREAVEAEARAGGLSLTGATYKGYNNGTWSLI
jgi:hypothetical protein